MPVDQETPPTPAPSRPRPGTVSWLDLSTPDVEGASRFYGALLGWAFEDTAAGSSRIARVRGRDTEPGARYRDYYTGAPTGRGDA